MKILKYPQDIATLKNIISKIDYSNALIPNCTRELLEKTCNEALKYSFAAVAVFPICSEYVANRLKGSSVNSQIAVGFPCGNHFIEVKLKEAEMGLIEIGASRSAGRYNMIEQSDAIGYQP